MRTIVDFITKLSRAQNGNVMLEFAIGGSILTSVFAGTFQFGYTFYQYNILKNAVSDGARYASLRTYDSSTSTPSNGYKLAVRNMVIYSDPAGGSTPIVSGLSTSNVNVIVAFSNGVPSTVTVSLSDFTIPAIFG